MRTTLTVALAVTAFVAVAASFVCWAGEESANWPTQSQPGAAVAPVFNTECQPPTESAPPPVVVPGPPGSKGADGAPGASGRDGHDGKDGATRVVRETVIRNGRPVIINRTVPAEDKYEKSSVGPRYDQWNGISTAQYTANQAVDWINKFVAWYNFTHQKAAPAGKSREKEDGSMAIASLIIVGAIALLGVCTLVALALRGRHTDNCTMPIAAGTAPAVPTAVNAIEEMAQASEALHLQDAEMIHYERGRYGSTSIRVIRKGASEPVDVRNGDLESAGAGAADLERARKAAPAPTTTTTNPPASPATPVAPVPPVVIKNIFRPTITVGSGDGKPGPAGLPGPTGSQGTQGIPGTPGTPGATGATGSTVKVAPASAEISPVRTPTHEDTPPPAAPAPAELEPRNFHQELTDLPARIAERRAEVQEMAPSEEPPPGGNGVDHDQWFAARESILAAAKDHDPPLRVKDLERVGKLAPVVARGDMTPEDAVRKMIAEELTEPFGDQGDWEPSKDDFAKAYEELISAARQMRTKLDHDSISRIQGWIAWSHGPGRQSMSGEDAVKRALTEGIAEPWKTRTHTTGDNETPPPAGETASRKAGLGDVKDAASILSEAYKAQGLQLTGGALQASAKSLHNATNGSIAEMQKLATAKATEKAKTVAGETPTETEAKPEPQGTDLV